MRQQGNIVRKQNCFAPRSQGTETRVFTAERQPPGKCHAGEPTIRPDARCLRWPKIKLIRENADSCPRLAERAGNKADSELTKTRHQSDIITSSKRRSLLLGHQFGYLDIVRRNATEFYSLEQRLPFRGRCNGLGSQLASGSRV